MKLATISGRLKQRAELTRDDGGRREARPGRSAPSGEEDGLIDNEDGEQRPLSDGATKRIDIFANGKVHADLR
jgi:hypothetical protein